MGREPEKQMITKSEEEEDEQEEDEEDDVDVDELDSGEEKIFNMEEC